MPYVDLIYYQETYRGDWPDTLTGEDFNQLETRASSIIDSLTSLRIRSTGLENLHSLVQEQVKKAVCAQIEYLVKKGTDSIHGTQLASVSLGDFSYQESSASSKDQPSVGVSPEVFLHLSSSGLLYAGRKSNGY